MGASYILTGGPLSVDHRLFMFYHFIVASYRQVENPNVYLKHISDHNLT